MKKTLLDNALLTNTIIQSASIQERKNHYTFARHMHKNIEIYHILDGTCHMEIGKQTINCKCNDFVMILPNIVHSFSLTGNEVCQFRHFHFSPDPFEQFSLEDLLGSPLDFLSALTFCCDYFVHMEADKTITNMTTSILRSINRNTPFSVIYANLYLTALLLHIIDVSGKNLSAYQKKHSIQNHYINFTLKYIEQHYTSKILIKDIADQLHISSRYLSKLFFQHMDMTLLNYINVYRMNQAVTLIATTDLSMTEIAYRIGMNDSQHFSNLFKSTLGSSPTQYRKILQKNDSVNSS